ncbi:GNAT family N-acetyltransferase [Sphingomonas sp.]|uniref:GNAT family N-acetyltransferase n=1 Tax=Sphingomonas sp. TaxID=28214 RepID=UPI0025D0BDAE|nr:GNAT family N-acetyltransferase [Sphingomonas sp.]
MDVLKATPADLTAVLAWLEQEYADDGEGFWCNRGIIEHALEYGDLWVIRRGGEPVAVQVGDYAADIVSVRKDCRRQGLGDALFAASLQRAIDDNVNVLSIECSPRSSWTFWERHGFERFGDLSEWGTITARRILERSFDLPSGLPLADVRIAFYPESATYGRSEIRPIANHSLRGSRLDDGAIMLGRRVIGLCDDEPAGKDLAVKIEVDGELRCFCKAKYEEAEDAGVRHDRKGGAFYIDAVEPH